MEQHCNKLTNKEIEALALLAEECGEVIQIIGKIFRHGLDSNWLDNPTNRELLETEIGDVLLAVGFVSVLMLKESAILKRIETKPEKMKRFLHYLDLDEFYKEGQNED